jgi:hypothetical protein
VVCAAPPEPFVPPELQGKPVVAVPVLHVGEPGEGAAVVEPLRALGPAVDLVAPMPYTAFQAALDASAPPGLRSYWRGEYMRELSDPAIDVFLAHAAGLVTPEAPLSQAVLFRIGQGVTATPDAAAAFSHRSAAYLFHPIACWADAADDDRMVTLARAFADAMRPFATGAAYLNFTPEADRVRDAFGDEKHARLVNAKDVYDPGNRFRLNQNIRPSHAAAPVG